MILLKNEQETLDFGKRVAQACIKEKTTIIYLNGDLGTGKTTFSRGFLYALGYSGYVKSPTYTLVESYDTKSLKVYHIDLYRIRKSEDLEFIGIRDFFINNKVVYLVEWPQKGAKVLPKQDIEIYFNYYQKKRRKANIKAISTYGNSLLNNLCN